MLIDKSKLVLNVQVVFKSRKSLILIGLLLIIIVIFLSYLVYKNYSSTSKQNNSIVINVKDEYIAPVDITASIINNTPNTLYTSTYCTVLGLEEYVDNNWTSIGYCDLGLPSIPTSLYSNKSYTEDIGFTYMNIFPEGKYRLSLSYSMQSGSDANPLTIYSKTFLIKSSGEYDVTEKDNNKVIKVNPGTIVKILQPETDLYLSNSSMVVEISGLQDAVGAGDHFIVTNTPIFEIVDQGKIDIYNSQFKVTIISGNPDLSNTVPTPKVASITSTALKRTR